MVFIEGIVLAARDVAGQGVELVTDRKKSKWRKRRTEGRPFQFRYFQEPKDPNNPNSYTWPIFANYMARKWEWTKTLAQDFVIYPVISAAIGLVVSHFTGVSFATELPFMLGGVALGDAVNTFANDLPKIALLRNHSRYLHEGLRQAEATQRAQREAMKSSAPQSGRRFLGRRSS